MADLSDVTAYLATTAANAVYPSGSGQPSIIAPLDCRIFEGWPNPDQLDRDMQGLTKDNPPLPRAKGPVPNVSVFPMQGTGVTLYQILDKTYEIRAAQVATTFALNGSTITVSGQVAVGEFLTLVIDDMVVCSQSGATTAAMLAALAAEAQGKGYPGASSTASSLTVPFTHSLLVRQGGKGLLGKVSHRQRHSIMVTVWAPTPDLRNKLAKAIDVGLKARNRVSMPDSSQATIVYNRTNTNDEEQSAGIYRRDLIFDVEYATVETFDGFTITSAQIAIANAVDLSVVANVTA
ncbi:hypothetical protein [Bradyrhizobium denitrificans]|uniref:hypothetical protein n=1 Tax=Bradyrhizobium denitrificans TaxID=2734912 RepID=UPI00155250D5|nr:hypothetical protein [Bradyrhizobium sp. LMG 8443]NPU23941.1 hypothetical protein [Bradyrhizobium sp. LMG 8443]